MTKEKPEMKPRKHAALWQTYLWYNEFLELRKTHLLRISAIEDGRSNMDAQFERNWIEDTKLDYHKESLGKQLARIGVMIGPTWQWMQGIKGLKSGLLPAQLVAQIDDINKFDTIAKLWRFCGYAVFDGVAEPKASFKAPHDKEARRHYNGRLKGILFNIAETFIKQQTPGYTDIYYAEKARQRELHPVAICKKCDIECIIKLKKVKGEEVQIFSCPNDAKHPKNFSDSHLHFRAMRKMMKTFLKDLWLEWRKNEGLEITEEWK